MVKKVVRDDAESILENVVEAMQEKKARQIISLNLSEIPNAVTKYFVICHAPSKIQVDAIYDNVVEIVQKQCGTKPYNREGIENSEWILIDYIDTVVHVFLEDIRAFYDLEGLWADAKLKEYKSDE
ncbi:MAG: ribosome silencing factor [Chlorobi bacterium]|nr:ribosome silencing factor [Chlorobiota bacterium]